MGDNMEWIFRGDNGVGHLGGGSMELAFRG